MTGQIIPVDAGIRALPGEAERHFPGGTIGFVCVMWDVAGQSMIRYSIGKSSPIPPRLVPAFLHDVMSEDMLRGVVHEVLDERAAKR